MELSLKWFGMKMLGLTIGCISKHVHLMKKHVLMCANMTCFAAKHSKFGMALDEC